jgi:uncharacterized protein (TIGR02172 family)
MLDRVIAVRKRKTVYRDGDFAIKLFDEGYSKADILNEALNQARIEETGINIPKIVEIKKFGGSWAIVLEYIQGQTLDKLIADNPDRIAEYLELFIDLQIMVHAQKAPLLNQLKDKYKRKIAQGNFDDNQRYELLASLEAMKQHEKVCHGDWVPSNIIIRDDGVPFIIDWSHATQGNASSDTAFCYTKFCMEGREAIAEQYLELFCAKTGTHKSYVKAWIPLVSAVETLKCSAEEKEYLMAQINIVDYQ